MTDAPVIDSPAPAPQAAPGQVSPPAPAPSPRKPSLPGTEHFADAYDELDKITEPEPQRKEPPKPKPDVKPEPAKADDKKPELSKPADTKPEPKEVEPSKMAPKQLREAYENLRKKHQQLEVETATLRNKGRFEDDPERRALIEKTSAFEKRLQELDTELKFANYEKSTEYKEKYWQPFESAYAAGREKAASIKIVDDAGNVRKGTQDDFDTYMAISDDDSAADFADKHFGKLKGLMEWHRQEVNKLNSTRVKAIEDYRKQGVEREKQRAGEMTRAQEAATKFWQQSVSEPIEKHPYLFKAPEDDTKASEILDKGFHSADRALSDGRPMKDGDKPLNPAELLHARSVLRNKAAAFDFQVYMRRKAEARIAELEKEIEAYTKSEPGAGDGGGRQLEEKTWEQELDALATAG